MLGARWYAGGLYIKDTLTGVEIQASRVYRVDEGDFVYNRLFAWKGSFALATRENQDCYVSNEFPCFRIRPDRLSGQYLQRYLSRSSTWDEALGLSTGGTPTSRNRLKEEAFLAMCIPLPPLAEQRRVVERIEALAAKVEEAKRLRQEATGEANALTKSILDATYAACEKRWGTVPLESATRDVSDGDHFTPPFVNEGVKFIFVGNVSTGRLHFRGRKYVTRDYFEQIKPSRKPEVGDVLYSAVGATLGIPAVVDTDEEFCFQRHVALLKPNQAKLQSKYLWYMLRSGILFRTAWESTTGSAQPTVPLRAIRKLPLPLPSLGEQQKIVDRLDSFQARISKLAEEHHQLSGELAVLLPAVLDRAFRGEL
jgi:type I restriction enzyme, S subunit